jgi:hypothetical protein
MKLYAHGLQAIKLHVAHRRCCGNHAMHALLHVVLTDVAYVS